MTQRFEMEIDGRVVEAGEGGTVLDAAEAVGIEIPTLCHDTRLEPAGCCRMCLVEVEGQRRLQPACTWKAQPGQVIRTQTERVKRHQQLLLSMYASDHGQNHEDAAAPPDRLREHCETHGGPLHLNPVEAPRQGRDDPNPYIHFDPSLCILCARCVRYCDEVEGVSAITLAGRGSQTTITTAADIGLIESDCELCGGCIDTCPTGAMREKKPLDLALPADTQTRMVRTTCN